MSAVERLRRTLDSVAASGDTCDSDDVQACLRCALKDVDAVAAALDEQRETIDRLTQALKDRTRERATLDEILEVWDETKASWLRSLDRGAPGLPMHALRDAIRDFYRRKAAS